MTDNDGFMSESEFDRLDKWYEAQARAHDDAADAWERTERHALIAHRAELASGERLMLRILLNVSVSFTITVLAGTCLWLRLKGRS